MHLTRWTDKHFGINDIDDLQARCNIANQLRADLFISIHCNSAGSSSAYGIETYALQPGGIGEKLAKVIQNELVAATGLVDRGVKYASYYVLRRTFMPAILIELGFISNPTEEQYLANPDFQDVCAKAIAIGVKKHLGIYDKEANKVAEQWKEEIMKWGQKKETLNLSPEHKADDPAPKWFVVAVAQRLMEALKNA